MKTIRTRAIRKRAEEKSVLNDESCATLNREILTGNFAQLQSS